MFNPAPKTNSPAPPPPHRHPLMLCLPPLLPITDSYLQMTGAKPPTTAALGSAALGSAPDLPVRHRSELSDCSGCLGSSLNPAAPAGCILIDPYQRIYVMQLYLSVLQFI